MKTNQAESIDYNDMIYDLKVKIVVMIFDVFIRNSRRPFQMPNAIL